MKGISPELLSRLEGAAREAAERSYSPYSRFPVGAAVLTEGGGIFSGCNVENACFGLTVCAERTAVWRAVAEGRRRILALALFTPTARAVPPCGTCRQVIHEFGPQARIISLCDSGHRLETTLDALLPLAFDGKVLTLHQGGEKER